jgi:DNA-binding response OmpR family regulator
MEMGADDYLTKPFGLELLNAIETRLKKKTVKTFLQ